VFGLALVDLGFNENNNENENKKLEKAGIDD